VTDIRFTYRWDKWT